MDGGRMTHISQECTQIHKYLAPLAARIPFATGDEKSFIILHLLRMYSKDATAFDMVWESQRLLEALDDGSMPWSQKNDEKGKNIQAVHNLKSAISSGFWVALRRSEVIHHAFNQGEYRVSTREILKLMEPEGDSTGGAYLYNSKLVSSILTLAGFKRSVGRRKGDAVSSTKYWVANGVWTEMDHEIELSSQLDGEK
jgi:hypothetical protein